MLVLGAAYTPLVLAQDLLSAPGGGAPGGGAPAGAGPAGGGPAGGGPAGADAPGGEAGPAKPAPAAQPAGGGAGLYQPAPGWVVNLGLTLAEVYTDRAVAYLHALPVRTIPLPPPPDPHVGFRRSITVQPDFITQITPTLSIHGDTPNVSMDLFYSPTASIYAQNGSRSGLAHNLNARAHTMVMENLFYVDMQAFAGLMPTLGGQGYGGGFDGGGGGGIGGGGGTPVTGQTAQRPGVSQTYSFGITPYVVQRFGGWGLAKLGVSARMMSAGTSQYTNGAGGNTTQPASNTQTLQETAEFTSGENLGRFQSQTITSGQQTTGSGLARKSSNYIAQTSLSYALTRWIAVFGQVGYETVNYAATDTSYQSNGITWSGGTKFTFGEDGYAKIGYGRRYGVNSVSFEGAYALTARTRITGRYWTGLGTEMQLLQADLANSGIDQYGGLVNLDTGAPVFLAGANGGGGNQNVYRTQNFNATLSSIVFNDPVSIGLQMSEQTLVATTGVATAFASKSRSINASWQHQLSELLGSSVTVLYGTRDVMRLGTLNTPIAGQETYIATNAGLYYTFSPGLVGAARYSHYEQTSNVQFRSYSQNMVMISLSKQF